MTHWLWLPWHWSAHLMGWDSVSDDPYAFSSGSGFILLAWLASVALWWWRGSCQACRLCLRHGRHELGDPETLAVHKVCWKHAGARKHIGRERIRQIQQAGHLYAGKHPGRG